MNTQSRWQKIPIRQLDRENYGRIQRAYSRNDGAMLLLHRPRSRNARWHDRIGTWAIVVGETLVTRKHVYGRRVRAVPTRWANSTIRQYRRGRVGLTCHLLHGRRPKIIESVQHMPVLESELPPVIGGPHLVTESATTATVGTEIPLELPSLPPHQLVSGKYSALLLSQAEHALYLERLRAWAGAYPEYDTPERRPALHDILMCEVLMHRLLLALGRRNDSPRLQRLYHSASRRRQKARETIGATRRQRMERIAPQNVMNVAVSGIWPTTR